MLRLATQVTSSPTISARSSSATSATAADLGAPGPKEGEDLVEPDVLPGPHALEHLADRAAGRRRRPGTNTWGSPPAPTYHCVERSPTRSNSAPSSTLAFSIVRSGQTDPGSSRAKPSLSDRSITAKCSASSIHVCGSRA